MKIIIATGMGEPEFSSNRGLIHAFAALGHEVITAGPPYWGRGHDADILLPDIPYPELYSYESILEQAPWQPDALINISPHCFMTGAKPPEIKSCLYSTDPHREGQMIYKIALQGSYNFLFLGQAYFIILFYDLPLSVKYLPVGFDERRFPLEDPYLRKAPECDITFVGQTGLHVEYAYRDDVGSYATAPLNREGNEKFAFNFHPGYDYAERGEILSRLCRDFHCKMYSDIWETPHYFRALRKGTLGFNCSLLHDLSIRCLEIAAAKRVLITDRVEDIWEVLSIKDPNFHSPLELQYKALCPVYGLHYKPFFPNFDLDYKEVYKIVKYWLAHDQEREALATQAYEHVWATHTWQHRAQSILEMMLNE